MTIIRDHDGELLIHDGTTLYYTGIHVRPLAPRNLRSNGFSIAQFLDVRKTLRVSGAVSIVAPIPPSEDFDDIE